MQSAELPRVTGYEGLRGRLATPVDESGLARGRDAVIELEDGARLAVPAQSLRKQDDGSYLLPLSPADVARLTEQGARDIAPGERLVIPVMAEQLEVGKRVAEVGRVRIRKHVHEHVESFDQQPLLQEQVVVERVPIHQYVDAPPEVRTEGDVLVVPLVEEVLVVHKRLVLREEVRIHKSVERVQGAPNDVVVRREEVEIERVAPEGPRHE